MFGLAQPGPAQGFGKRGHRQTGPPKLKPKTIIDRCGSIRSRRVVKRPGGEQLGASEQKLDIGWR